MLEPKVDMSHLEFSIWLWGPFILTLELEEEERWIETYIERGGEKIDENLFATNIIGAE